MFRFFRPSVANEARRSTGYWDDDQPQMSNDFYVIEEVVDANGYIDDCVRTLGSECRERPTPLKRPKSRVPIDLEKARSSDALRKFFSR